MNAQIPVSNAGSEIRLQPGEPLAEGLGRAWTCLIDGAAKMNQTAAADEEELVHQLRVTVKKLRALLRLIQPAADRAQLRRIDADLREASQLLADARRESVHQAIRQKMSAASSDDDSRLAPKTDELRAELVRRLGAHHDAMKILTADGFSWKMMTCGFWRIYRRAKRRLANWRQTGDLQQAHEFRKHVKHLKYGTDFLHVLDGEKLARWGDWLREIEEDLGNLNDLRELHEIGDDRQIQSKTLRLAKRIPKRASKRFSRSRSKFLKILEPAEEAWRKQEADS